MASVCKFGCVEVKSLSLKPKLPRFLLWDDKKSEDDFLSDPFEKVICILLKETSEKENFLNYFPRLAILNEAFYQCTRIVYENVSNPDIENLELDIKANIGLKYYSKWVLKMMYAILATRKNNSKEVMNFMESFDVFNFMMKDNKVYLNYIKKVKNSKNKQIVDLSPKPCPIEQFKSHPILWEEVTSVYNEAAIRSLLKLWPDKLNKIWLLDIIDEYRKDIILTKPVSISDVEKLTQLFLRIKLDICNSNDIDCASEPLLPPEPDDEKETDYVVEISRLKEQNQELKTKVIQKDSELNRQKDEKQQERAFSLSMILDYSLNHVNQDNGLVIINMLNRFFRDLGNSSDEERRLVDEVENKILHPNNMGGNTFNNANVTMYGAQFDGPMYDVKGNHKVNIGGAANGHK